MDQLSDLFPKNDKDELFTALDSKKYWLLLMVDLVPVTQVLDELAKTMPDPPKTFSVKGLPPVICLPKSDFNVESLAGVMSTAAPGHPLPPEILKKALGDRDLILCSEPGSIQIGIEAMNRLVGMHKEWKAERFGMQLFTVTYRLYHDDFKEAIDFLIWVMAGIVCQTGAKTRTDIEIVTGIADTIQGATIGGQKKAEKTMSSLKESERFLEPAMKILDEISEGLDNRGRAISVLRMWIKSGVDPNNCATWVASNIGLYMTHYEQDNEGMLRTIAEQMLLRIRNKVFAAEIWRKRRSSESLEEDLDEYIEKVKADFIKGIDEEQKIEGDKD